MDGPVHRTDVLILGCGVAGACAAIEAAELGRHVVVLRRGDEASESNSSWAQGGIVGRGRDDSVELLERDILGAGAGLSYPPAVRILADEGPRFLDRFLIDRIGVSFDTENGDLAFGLEAAHSARRILHVGDATGRAIMDALLARLESHPNVTLLSGRTAIDLLTFPHHSRDPLAVYEPVRCHGAYVLDQETGRVEPWVARSTVLATGGLGQIYLYTTNPGGARGDGIAMAYRAGARVIQSQFVQFHPTALDMPGSTKFLISEAVRGEGAVLRTPEGEPFMHRYDERRELAPRDVVARAIFHEMLAHDWGHVYLDIASRMPADRIRARFPHIHRLCLERDIDITRRPIPVLPAAHYFCGGVFVDAHGRTTVDGLYAVGEVACTGVHGANRLASTSLLEGIVWGIRAARHLTASDGGSPPASDAIPPWDDSGLTHDADPALIQGDLQTVRTLMWHYVGLVRNGYRLKRAVNELSRLGMNIEDFYRQARLTDALVGLRNAALVALIVAREALRDPVSRGCHHREDHRSPRGAAPPPLGQQQLDSR